MWITQTLPHCTEDNPCKSCSPGVAGEALTGGAPKPSYSELQAELTKYKGYWEAQRTTIQNLQTEIRDLEEDLEDADTQVNGMCRVENVVAERKNYEYQLDQLRKQNKEKSSIIIALEAKLKIQQSRVDSLSKMLQDLGRYQTAAPSYVVSERALTACLEFARTVAVAKDKLMMTRTKP